MGALLPIGAALMMSGHSSWAEEPKALREVTITDQSTQEDEDPKATFNARRTTIGKGNQALRDIPQSVTVVTEKLINDRNQDTLKDVLHQTAGITFQASEGGEEDIKLRGFSLAAAGDIYLDGIRDSAFYERDTFNMERVEVLRGSASLLFGRGSTGGVANQVSKKARAWDESEVDTTVGNHNYRRVTGDFNIQTGENEGLRINAMVTKADNNGAGSKIDKKGLAIEYRVGIGEVDENYFDLYSINNNNGINYGIPWVNSGAQRTIAQYIDPSNYYGMASDYNRTTGNFLTGGNIHRFEDNSELHTRVRVGKSTRDLRSAANRWINTTTQDNISDNSLIGRGSIQGGTYRDNTKIQDLAGVYFQSDYSKEFEAWGYKHQLLSGIDAAYEEKNVYAASPISGKPNTSVGTPDDGAWVDEDARAVSRTGGFRANNFGLYAQDTVHLTEQWKAIGGLRFDKMRGGYDTFNQNTGALTATYSQAISAWSHRFGVLYQPNEQWSYYASYGTSFNTSGDTYSYNADTVSVDPEKSRNIEFGGKYDSPNHDYSLRWAAFYSTKYNERNTDPDINQVVLSGRRHASGMEFDYAGRLGKNWEIYTSYMWMPDALIDANTATTGELEGARPSMTPVHSGSAWATYSFNETWRSGAGINFRSEQTPNRNPGFKVPGYATLDLMTEYQYSKKVTIKGNVTNALNKLYADALYTNFYVPGAGRLIQVGVNVKF
ncbi:TonB-dependent siderophore receptor [Curvibacter sp. CHRR-16]|uniref:TonB-dependent receptor n=1 Tax=Curvibacter sp. CHRR-16 TaxID=2835872 RepID=UPI001BDB43E4|nr:TonB-dependent siderophore receptor [Curvibacter sp. CHRR-16]MBT0571161.1 TonB-dependent siderophore receptor [Curvibacter sp. CHRR-16]